MYLAVCVLLNYSNLPTLVIMLKVSQWKAYRQHLHVHVCIYFGFVGRSRVVLPPLSADSLIQLVLARGKIIKFCARNILSEIKESVFCVIFNNDSGKT